jgi:hypothetical protein
MDHGPRSPFADLFRRGEVPRDIRWLAAQGALGLGAVEQLTLLTLLTGDEDAEIAAQAGATLDALPSTAVAACLARRDVPDDVRAWFAGRGVSPAALAAGTPGAPEPGSGTEDGQDDSSQEVPAVLSSLPVIARIKLAMKGTREQRAQLIRDSSKLVAAAVLSSPKLTESEVEAFARMPNVSEDVLRVIAANRTWVKNYAVAAGLARNPKTPPAISMGLLHRLNQRDVKTLSMDRNVPESVRIAARKIVVKSLSH